MRSNAIRVIAIVMVVFAIILAFVAYRYSHRLASDATQTAQDPNAGQPAVKQQLIIVAVKPLALDKAIERDSVALVPMQVVPAEFYTNVEDVVGKKPMIDVDAGTPVTPRLFKGVSIIARRIPAGFRALSLKVDDVVGTGGFIRPGDVVDVLLFVRSVTDAPTGGGGKGKDNKSKKEDIATQARYLLKDVTVLAYEDHVVDPPKGIDDKDKNQQQQNNQRRERTAVVAVPETEVTRVMLGASLGDLRLALHPQLTDLVAVAPVAAAVTSTTPAASAQDGASGQAPAAGSGAALISTPAAGPAAPSSSTAAVSAIPDTSASNAAAASATQTVDASGAPVLPLSDAEKAKIEAAKVPDGAITAVELARVKPAPDAEIKKKKVMSRPRIEIYRGTTRTQS